MTQLQLFQGISQDELDRMLHCFKPEERSFRKGETIMIYSQELGQLCLLLKGKAHLYCMDSDGEYTLLESYRANDVFGEIFAMPCGSLGYAVEADSDCTVLFIRFSAICGRCEKACDCHSRLTANLFRLSAAKSQALSLRINMLSKRSLRKKLMAYFDYLSGVNQSNSFDIEFSLSQLSSFLCSDRSSMMRELKSMCRQGLIQRQGRRITILNTPCKEDDYG